MKTSFVALAFVALLGEPPATDHPNCSNYLPCPAFHPPSPPLSPPPSQAPLPLTPSPPLPSPPPGLAQAATYTSVTDAVKQLPELSTLKANLDATPLSAELSSPAFVGTVFLPTNAAMAAISEKVRGWGMALLRALWVGTALLCCSRGPYVLLSPTHPPT